MTGTFRLSLLSCNKQVSPIGSHRPYYNTKKPKKHARESGEKIETERPVLSVDAFKKIFPRKAKLISASRGASDDHLE